MGGFVILGGVFWTVSGMEAAVPFKRYIRCMLSTVLGPDLL